jgi:hypothetical protein
MLPSLHATLFAVFWHPVRRLQESVVHGLPSLQFGPIPPTQTPPTHASPIVHWLPSLQPPRFGVYTQPDCGLHASSVHTLPSLQDTGPPAPQLPPAQVSPEVQALPSEHGAEFGAFLQPEVVSH